MFCIIQSFLFPIQLEQTQENTYNENVQKIPQSHNSGPPTTPRGRDIEHKQLHDNQEHKVKQPALFLGELIAKLENTLSTALSNSYTMGCPPVRGDNPRALASGLSYVQVDKHGITILYHLHQCRHCTSRDISFQSWLGWYKNKNQTQSPHKHRKRQKSQRQMDHRA